MILQSFYIGDNHAEVTMMLSENPLHDKEGRPAVVICPGGSYMYVSDREAEPVAYEFLAKGYHVFILRYSTLGSAIRKEGRKTDRDELYQIASAVADETVLGSEFPGPLTELAKTMTFIRENCHEFNVNPDKIGVVGFSAGGHLAASLGVHWNSKWLEEKVGDEPRWYRPDFQVLGYPILDYLLNKKIADTRGVGDPQYMSIASRMVFGSEPDDNMVQKADLKQHISKDTPPTFIWHTVEDQLVFIQNSLDFAKALDSHRIPWELHTFQHGQHGLSLATEVTGIVDARAAEWKNFMFSWLDVNLK
ncbi:MAG TPA: alpha/beta hydrolase [Candidatus Salinicoccus stercoripullorum]|uniref:Alpha/beta hydrolase n=1 Tax=Candidatus Salinicoccus stercoripullorum TaxID=2838756 RepID=A0A9D1U010_9STAP|nr:alpha/beta hydrolase [Candidatus Salinicoccus stercoripullorum]